MRFGADKNAREKIKGEGGRKVAGWRLQVAGRCGFQLLPSTF
jgi:hypothetical protein